MKKLPLLSLAVLCLVFACESESVRSDIPSFVYNTDQQYMTTETFVIDFETYNAGDIVSEIFITDPFENAQVAGITMAFPDANAAMIFDSSNPTGSDFDIGTPNEQYGGPGIGAGGASNDTALGNVLILSEDLDSNDPDDIFELGAHFLFDFSANENVTLNGFDILDIEASANPTVVNLYDASETVLLSKEVTPGGDNSKVTVDLESTSDVAYLEIIMNSSGAIDNIALEMTMEEDCVECDSDITSLTFQYTGGQDEVPVRVETTDGEIILETTVAMNSEFTVSGNDTDGSFTTDIVLFIDNQQLGTLATDCSQVIGPGFIFGDVTITAGTTLSGGQLCPVEIAF